MLSKSRNAFASDRRLNRVSAAMQRKANSTSSGNVLRPAQNQEMDAGFVRMLSERTSFLPVRARLPAKDLPPLLRGLHSPEVRDVATDLKQLIHDIHGVTRKPPLGPPPPAVAARGGRSGASPAAEALARVFVEHTEHATGLDPRFSKKQLADLSGLSMDDLADAIYELRGRVKEHAYSGGGFVVAEPTRYADFDAMWQPWDPAKDAILIAADLLNDADSPGDPGAIAERYGWSARRLNPALAYLIDGDLVEVRSGMGDGSFLCYRVLATHATRRFVKSRRTD